MKRSPQASETSFVLSQSLQRRLNTYAFAASAAGVSMLALAQPSQAKVVYTKAHQVIGQNGVYNLDLNHDGTVDFLIQEWDNGAFSSSNALLADAALGNAVRGSKVGFRYLAAALQRGAPIGPKRRFITGGNNGEVMVSITHFTTGGTSYINGFWANVRNRYLGLKFKIDGKTHYGWARLSVQLQQFHVTATLTGYAYETIPNKEISAGQTDSGADGSLASPNLPNSDTSGSGASVVNPSDSPQSTSLGALALGAQSVPPRRRP
ncbi:MAG TPA: hypothetical protein VN948_14535 [Terriglobales bacterium]|nr:hypothetical protein [Terriglobales bacterium]